MGIHFTPGEGKWDQPQTSTNFTQRWRVGVRKWMDWVEKHSTMGLWKDITPGHLPASNFEAKWLELMNREARDVITSVGSSRIDWKIWPLHNLLTFEKNNAKKFGDDFKHCSQMHDHSPQERKELDFRTPSCQMAVQLLLNQLC